MERIIQTEYGISVRQTNRWDDKDTFTDDTYLYFLIPSSGGSAMDMEQATLAYYLQERNFQQIALPIPKLDGNWYVSVDDKQYLVMRANIPLRKPVVQTPGIALARFHQASDGYTFMPQEISSYGQWKDLWANKVTVFEKHLEAAAQKHSGNYYGLVMDIMPYVIGRSENAIQYMNETESDPRYHQGDRGVIGFRRFSGDTFSPIIWPNELVYDHPVRDIAEFLRKKFLSGSGDGECLDFLKDYQSIKRLSVFSVRMLYARLIFPVDLFDCLEKGLKVDGEEQFSYGQLEHIVEKQELYEQRLANLFQMLEIDEEQWQIPVLHWL